MKTINDIKTKIEKAMKGANEEIQWSALEEAAARFLIQMAEKHDTSATYMIAQFTDGLMIRAAEIQEEEE